MKADGTVMVVVNSMCGCAAGKARPGIAMALQHARRPDLVATVFAGNDVEATSRAREYFAPNPPSSPSVALLRNGQLLWMLHRRDIETRDAATIAAARRLPRNSHSTSETSSAPSTRLENTVVSVLPISQVRS